MRLHNLIRFLNNLNNNTELYLRINGTDFPMSKVTITADECLIYPGERIMTKKRFYSIIRQLHVHNLPLWIIDNDKKIPAYGIQISIEHGRATLM